MIFKYIEEITEQLLRDLGLFSIPVDVFEIARQKGITVTPVNTLGEVSGLFVINDKMSHISYNANEPETRQRFTVAHELAHSLLHSKHIPLFVDKPEKIFYRNIDSSSGEYQMEREANAFAAALLMPNALLQGELKKSALDMDMASNLTDHLAKRFNVSEQAMTFRLTNLGLIDFGLF